MASGVEEELQCQICLDMFKNPVILSCSHSFCKVCLETWWTNKATKECPTCKEKHVRADVNNLPSNLALRKLCEAFQEQKANVAATPLCTLHLEKLKLFCLDHLQPVCLVCQASKAHNNHTFKPIDEAAQDYREELCEENKRLKNKLKQREIQLKKYGELSKYLDVQALRTQTQIQEEFAKLYLFLRKEEQERLAVLREEKTLKMRKITEKIDIITTDILSLRKAIEALAGEVQAGDVRFLSNYKDIVEQVDKMKEFDSVDGQKISARALIDEAKHLLNLGQRIWMKMKDTVTYRQFILDPNTAGARLVVSDDLTTVCVAKSMQKLPENPERLSYYCVLGSEGFTHGVRHWEVEVKDNENWGLGVATVAESPDGAYLTQIWRLCYCEGTYSAETKSGELTLLNVDPRTRPQQIRVGLSVDGEKLLFYDAEKGTHLCTFTWSFCGDKLYPYMFTEDKTPLKILPQKGYMTLQYK
ncbi:unnamed protein product [Knipowitschia caucasica]